MLRIYVYANSSSNHITGAIENLRDHPFFRYLDEIDAQTIVSMSMDDPGVFGTRIDAEYVLMLEVMLENGIDRHRALRIINHAHQIAIDHAFGRRRRLPAAG